MFVKADKDKDGSVSFDEFKTFLQKENQEVVHEHQDELREAVAKNMEQHGGKLEVQDGSKTITVNVPGVNPDDIRHHK
jgi:hypothetical protein